MLPTFGGKVEATSPCAGIEKGPLFRSHEVQNTNYIKKESKVPESWEEREPLSFTYVPKSKRSWADGEDWSDDKGTDFSVFAKDKSGFGGSRPLVVLDAYKQCDSSAALAGSAAALSVCESPNFVESDGKISPILNPKNVEYDGVQAPVVSSVPTSELNPNANALVPPDGESSTSVSMLYEIIEYQKALV